MAEQHFAGRLVVWVALVWLGSCAADSATTVRAGGGGQEPAAGERVASDVAPASLRMAALRAMQQAPGYDFEERSGPDRALSARMGSHGREARVEVAGDRVTIVPGARDSAGDATADGVFSLRTMRVGRANAARAPREGEAPEARAQGQEVVITRDGGIEERYLAGPLGLEQSYRIDQRSEGAGPLVIVVAFEGLVPDMEGHAGEAEVVNLVDHAGDTRAVYRDLFAVDAAGQALPARMVVQDASVMLVVDDDGAVYPLAVDPLVGTQQAKLVASDGVTNDLAGTSVSVSGDTAVVGVPARGFQQGCAYVFVRTANTWTEQAKLTASDGANDDVFGRAVGVSGDTVVVGAYTDDVGPNTDQGSAYVFVRTGTSWSEQAKLTASDGAAQDRFGASVAVSGDTALVGAYKDDVDAGSAYAYVRSGTSWSEQAKLTASDRVAGDQFGYGLHVSGDTAVVGARQGSGGVPNAGAAYVYVRSGTSWSEQAKLTASDGAAQDRFGHAVAVSGDTAVVGADGRDGAMAQPDLGAAYVYARSGTSWSEQATLTASDAVAYDSFGESVSVSGATVVVGAYGADGASTPEQGAAYVYARSGTTWSEQSRLEANDGTSGDQFGDAVSLAGDTLVVGAPRDDVGGKNNQGSAYAFVVASALGDGCATGVECASGLCADGVCCDAACGAVCEACTAAKKGSGIDGACSFVAASSDPDDECGVGAEQSCDGAGACKLVLAQPCGASAECLSGACADSLCCDDACAAPCEACTGAKKGSGVDGACGPVAAFTDPDDECGVGAEQSCNGAGACRTLDGASCAGGAECFSGLCSDGVCCDTACGGECEACTASATGGTDGVCAPISVGTDPDDECGLGAEASCDGAGTCRLALGQPCGADIDCATGHCVDGVCCDTACDGACQTCTAAGKGAGSDGACGPVAADTDPDDECAADLAAGVCADGSCDGAGQCRATLPPGTPCGAAASCNEDDGVVTTEGQCNAAADCVQTTLPCSPYQCAPNGSCVDSCASAADCVGGHVCRADGKCVAPLAPAPEDAGGCDCRLAVGRGADGSHAAWLALLGLGLVGARRRSRAGVARGPRARRAG